MIPLIEIDKVPEGLLTLKESRDLHLLLPHPTLLYLEGGASAPLFISVLLHGNEDTGLFAVQKILQKYEEKALPRPMIIFFGNIYAAKEGLRRLDGQPDYNRVWPGGEDASSPEASLIAKVVERVRSRRPFASIDIHNNTGKNPHYGCINALDPASLYLASLFSRTVVYFETPKGVQSMALAEQCPAITIECGKPHVSYGVEHASEFVDTLLHLEGFEHHHISHHGVDAYHTVAAVTIHEENSFSFSESDVDIRLLPELEDDNFTELPEGTPFAHLQPGTDVRFEAQDDEGRERFDDLFTVEDDVIRLKKAMMPAMITLDERVIRQDCFCYLMERIDVADEEDDKAESVCLMVER